MKISDILRMLSAGLSNQAISSFTNFAFSLYLLRQLSPIDFGLYNIGFAIMLFFGGFGQSFFLLQMVVHTPGKPVGERANYAGRILLMLIIACVLGAVLVGSAVYIVQILIGRTFGSERYMLWVGIMSVAYVLKEFYIRNAFNEGKGRRAVNVHIALALALLSGVYFQKFEGQTLTLEISLALYAGAHAIAAIIGHVISRVPLKGHSLLDLRKDLAEIAHGGRWASSANIVYFLRGWAHTIVVATLLGPVGVAKISAARIFVTPAVLAIPALSQVVLPRLAAVVENGDMLELLQMRRRIGLGLISVAVVYSMLLLAVWPRLSGIVLGESYFGLFWIVAIWCIYACFLALRNSLEWVVQATKMFREIMIVGSISAIVALFFATVLTRILGLEGAVMGLVIAEGTMIVGLWLTMKNLGAENEGPYC